jgi:hypothetical protein
VLARLFTDFINSLPPERIDIELTERTRTLSLNCARFEAKIKGIDAEEFPLVPTHLKGTTVKLDAATLCRAINQVVFAASTDESRPILTGVLLKLNNRKMVLTAADGFQIAARTVELPEAVKTPVNIVVPARALSEVARILGNNGDEGEVTMTITSARNQVLFSFPKKIDCLSAVCYTNTKGGDSNASVASHRNYCVCSVHVSRAATVRHRCGKGGEMSQIDFYSVGLALLIGIVLGFIAGRQPWPSRAPSRPSGAVDDSETRPPSGRGIRAFVILLNDTLESQGIPPLTQEQTDVLQAMIEDIVGVG